MHTPSPRPLYRLHAVILALALFSLLMSAVVSRSVFERLPHLEDEVAYLFQAKVFARGDLVIDSPTPFNAYWQPFVIDHSSGTRFSKYPPGWSALLSVGVNMGAPFVVNALFAALNVILAYRLAADAFDRRTGFTAAVLVAFSPMALLLNGTLMGHTPALTGTTLFMWAYLRMTRSPQPLRWGVLAGVALGSVVINRPLTGVGVALPFILYSGLTLLRQLVADWRVARRTLRPLLALSAAALTITAAIPIYNAAATGDPSTNLYTLVPGWEYDRVGFGAGYGRNGHILEKGVQHLRYDLSLTAADLFGWQVGRFTVEPESAYNTRASAEACANLDDPSATLQQHLRTCSGYWRGLGLSWILLLPGLLVGLRRGWAWAWAPLGLVWAALLPEIFFTHLGLWVAFGVAWALTPLLLLVFRDDDGRGAVALRRESVTWLLFGVIFSLLAVHVAYWVGSQRYSTRYYFEALTAAAILSALPIAWLMRRFPRWDVEIGVVLLGVMLWSLVAYSTPRIHAWYGYNAVTQGFIDAVQAQRQSDAPALVLMQSDSPRRWRSHGALMAVTSPYLDSEIVVAWQDANIPDARALILNRFPDREVIRMGAAGDYAWFIADCVPDVGCTVVNDPAQPGVAQSVTD